MKVIFIPFNNQGFEIDPAHRNQVMTDIFDHMFVHHLEPNEEAIVFMYLSDPSYNLLDGMTRFPMWVKGANIIVRKRFSTVEAENMAMELAEGEPVNVVSFKPVPDDLLSDPELDAAHRKEKNKWDWGYCFPIEAVRK